jgi:O-antigen/teichoic acid export membrane protein
MLGWATYIGEQFRHGCGRGNSNCEPLKQRIMAGSNRVFRLAAEGGWIVLGQVVAVVGSLFLVRVLTEYLEPAEYGELALGLTIAGLVNQVVMGGLVAAIGRYYPIASESGSLYDYLKASLHLLGYAVLIVCLIGVVFWLGLAWTGQTRWNSLLLAVIAFAILNGLNSSLSGVQNAARQRSIVALHGGMDAWLKIAAAVGVMLWIGSSSTAVVIGYVLSVLVVTASQMHFLGRLVRSSPVANTSRPNDSWSMQLWSYAWPFSTWGMFTWAQQVSDRWALQTFATLDDVGLYAVAFQLGYGPMILMTGMAVTFLAPIIYQRAGGGRSNESICRIYRLLRVTAVSFLAITLIAFTVTYALHEIIFSLLVAESFRHASIYLPWMVLSAGLYGTGTALAIGLQALRLSKERIIKKIIVSTIGVILVTAGAMLNGTSGVIFGGVLFSLCYMISTYMLVNYHMRPALRHSYARVNIRE